MWPACRLVEGDIWRSTLCHGRGGPAQADGVDSCPFAQARKRPHPPLFPPPCAQDELAKHTQRAASTIELQAQELGMLKDRIRWVGSGRRGAHPLRPPPATAKATAGAPWKSAAAR